MSYPPGGLTDVLARLLSLEGNGDFMRKQALICEDGITPLKLEMAQ